MPPFLRYLPARLKPLSNPFVWLPALAATLLVGVIWEYRTHPEWLGWSGPDTASALDDTLTPDEQGQIAEIDNLDVLFEEDAQSARERAAEDEKLLDSADDRTGNRTFGNGSRQESRQDRDKDASAANADNQASADSGQDRDLPPFAAYLDQYRFGGSQAIDGNATNLRSAANRASNDNNRIGGGTTNLSLLNSQPALPSTAAAPTESALGTALRQQAAARAATSAETSGPSLFLPPSPIRTSAATSDTSLGAPAGTATATGSSANLPFIPFSQQPVVRGTLPGNSNVSFIQTTPAMSPPPGTTGYVPPASINLSTYNNVYGRTSQPTAAPSLQLRQPQSATNVLPTAGRINPGTGVQPAPLPFGSNGTAIETAPRNAYDAYFNY